MNKQVTITANPKTGKVFTQAMNADGSSKKDKNGKEHGFIRVESQRANLGFAYNGAIKKRSCLIAMTAEAFASSAAVLGAGSTHDGVIVREDSLTPFYEGQKPLSSGGENPQTITSGGAEVYRNEFFSENVNRADIKLASYDKIEEVVVAKAAETKLA